MDFYGGEKHVEPHTFFQKNYYLGSHRYTQKKKKTRKKLYKNKTSE